MKNLFFLFLILFIQQTSACVCGIVPLIEKTSNSDFIAKAKILKVSPDEDSRIHNIQIEILDLFKGEKVKDLKLYSALGSSCSFYTPENTTWLIFATKNKQGNLSFGYCSGAKLLDRKNESVEFPYAEKNRQKSIELKLGILGYMNKKKILAKNEYDLRTFISSDCLEQFKGFEIKNDRFALYELTVEKDLSIGHVTPLKEFDNEHIKSDLLKCIKEGVKVYHRKRETKIDSQTKLIFALFYYPASRGYECFIGQYDV